MWKQDRTDYNCGLSNKEVGLNRKEYGTNQIKKVKQRSFFRQLLETLGDPIIKILLVALVIKTVFLFHSFDWFETLGIVIAIFLASFVSTISEYGSEQAFAKLQEESAKIKCRVKRNSQVMEVEVDDIVVNDIVLLETGDKIPADGIIVFGSISVDESSLNGEAKEISKVVDKKGTMTNNNSCFRGTVVYDGNALLQVTKVGDETFYGKMARELQEIAPDSPLKIRLRGLARVISRIGYCGAFLVAFSYLFSVLVIDNNFDLNLILATIRDIPVLTGYILYAMTLSVTIIVVAVPEGLPMMITLVLSSNMKRMLKSNVLVRKLVGIETAGSINILFTDKTGTLTKGKLEVVGFMSGGINEYKSEQELYTNRALHSLVKLSIVENNASSYTSDKKIVGGNITDRALLNFIKSTNDNEVEKISNIVFSSERKYSSTIVRDKKWGLLNLIKGSPEIILPRCSSYYSEFGTKLPGVNIKEINKLIDSTTRRGIRVIAFAINNNYHVDNLDNLTFLGLAFIKDDIRKEAIKGIGLVKSAGIETVMITGDNKETACAIGKEVGLITSDDDLVLTGSELKLLSDQKVMELLPKLKIVARSLPADKSRLVKLSEQMGLVVGMTGDGVNDAPALKSANVGFAMGSGTEVAKEASEIVILDDNFLSIAKAILFGRTTFKSIRKFIIFQLTVNFCAIFLSIIGPFIGAETPVTVIQMLWINMIMDTLAGIAFAYEPPLEEYMKEPPKKKKEAIINKYMLGEILFTGLYSSLLCLFFLKSSWIHELFRMDNNNKYLMTAFFGLFIFMGIFNCFNARTNRLNLLSHLYQNKIFMLVIAFILVVQVYLIYFGGTLFRTFGLTLKEFEIMILLAATVIPVDFIRKIWLRLRKEKLGV